MGLSEILKIKMHQVVNIKKSINEVRTKRIKQIILTSGSKNFDDVLGGGFCSGETYLIFGANKTGKTQLCHQLCVWAYKKYSMIYPNSGKKDLEFVYYFDTENTFRPERIKEIGINSYLEYEKILKSVLVAKITSNSALFLSLKNIEDLLDPTQGGVLIIDTINNYFRSELGNKNISYNKAKETFLNILKNVNELTRRYNLITIITAQVAPNFSEKALIRVLPVGNQFLNHYFSEYIYLSYKDKDKSYVQIVNSFNLPEKKLFYKITPTGFQDYEI